MDRNLEKLIEDARNRPMSQSDWEEQRINFAYGNARDGDNSTKETVRAASTIMRQESAA